MILTVFGGSAPKPGSAAYQSAQQLGQLAAQAGWTVATGGYIGIMEAVSRGAAESGGHVIGVTCKELGKLRPTGANPWVKETREFDTLRERLGHLIDCCDAAIALPGGVGTLAEITVMWNGLIIDALQPKPFVLVGNGWQQVMESMYVELGDYIPAKDRSWFQHAVDVESAFQQIAAQVKPKIDN